jgi:histidine triad (HIT) family protein
MASVFTQIIQGEIPSYKLHEDDLTISILTIEPIHLGHALVIPKLEVNHWFDVPEAAYLQVARNAQKIGKAIQAATRCPRVLTATIGFEVPHYHLHLIPAWSMGDLSFANAKKRSESEMKEVQKQILQHLK